MENYLLHLLSLYQYPILVPVALIEGHIISLVCGFLARLGLINPVWAGACIVTGNLIGDVLLYWLGFHKGEKILHRGKKWFGISEQSVEKAKGIFHKHTAPVLIASKLTNGFGMAAAVLFTAGLMRIQFGMYMLYNLIGECLWTALLIWLGYVIGSAYTNVSNVILRTGTIVISCGIAYLVFRLARTIYINKVQS